MRPLHTLARTVATTAAVCAAGLVATAGPAAAAPAPAPAPSPAPSPPPSPAAVPAAAMPCAPTVKACVDLSEQKAWLSDGAGRVTRGPVDIGPGTRTDPSPTGTFTVDYKDADHVSNLYDSPMPNSVFFAPAIAFHEGNTAGRSHGCIRLSEEDGQRFYDALAPGDGVQVLPGAVATAPRAGVTPPRCGRRMVVPPADCAP